MPTNLSKGNVPVNSKERHAARRKRREEQRAAKRAARIEACTLESVADLANLCVAADKAANGVRWKASVQRYHLDTLGNAMKLREQLLAGEDFHRGYVRFKVVERGKVRDIASVRFSERVAQKSLNVNALMPAVRDTLIADNSANIKGRGTDYAVSRLKVHLASHYRKHGADGYILLGDFSNFFGSIPHEVAKELIRKHLDDEALIAILCAQIDHQDGEVGLSLGSEINQTLAVSVPSPIDHLVVECCGVEAYGRYMDDFYAIDADKDRLQLALGCIEAAARGIGLTLNAKKTHIVKLTHGFTYLKRQFSYGERGRVYVRPHKSGVKRARRRMRRQARLVACGRMTYEQAYQSYMSWRGMLTHMDAHDVLRRMDALFAELFDGFRPDGFEG